MFMSCRFVDGCAAVALNGVEDEKTFSRSEIISLIVRY